MPNSADRTPESTIREGKQHYAAKRFRPALEQFTRAMRLCPCNRGMKRERCSCKDYEKVASEAGSIFKEAMYKCTCNVGKTFNKCDDALHIQALDYRAATFEALQELERARRDAEWILELAPRLPDGYLRLGKIARLQKNHELAWAIYNAGIEVGNNNRLAGSPKLQKLYAARQPLQLRFCRKDPLKYPQEIVHRIFYYLDFASLVRCLCVSKEWRRYLISRGNERLWRSLLFTKIFPHRHAPSINAIRKLVSYSRNDVRQLAVDNVSRFRLNQPKLLAMLNGAKRLEYLSLKGTTDDDIKIPQRPGILDNLTHIVLKDFVTGKPHVLQSLLLNSAAKLQYLQLCGFPQSGTRTDLDFPHMPCLKYLRFEEHNKMYPTRLEIFLVAAKTPNLEQLWLSDVSLGSGGLVVDEIDSTWKDLKVIVVNGTTDYDQETSEIIRRITSIRRGCDLQDIDFDFRWKYDDFGPLGLRMISDLLNQQPAAVSEDEFDNNNYKNVRSLRLTRALIKPAKLQQVLHDSIMFEKLQTLDLVFPLETFGSPLGHTSAQHLKDHAWLRGAVSVRCLGIFEFRFRTYPKNDDDLPLPSFLASFPNLEVLEVNSSHYEGLEFCSVIEAILKVTKLKRIYQTTVKGVYMDQLKAFAAKSGVELIWGERPRTWPVAVEL